MTAAKAPRPPMVRLPGTEAELLAAAVLGVRRDIAAWYSARAAVRGTTFGAQVAKALGEYAEAHGATAWQPRT